MKRTPSGLNLLVGIDKPCGMTSHDVVNKVRRALGERRVGHAGTLDPFASGILVVGVGQATRLMQYATSDFKSYTARISWGMETLTDDLEGEVRCEAPVPEAVLDKEYATAALERLSRQTEQVPPAFSAIKVDGVRAYSEARKGHEVELAARPIEVRQAELLAMGVDERGPWWDVDFTVSKGTYIRALARDLGRMCESAAHLSALSRTSSGKVDRSSCMSLSELEQTETLRVIDPVELLGFPVVQLDEQGVADIKCGKKLSCARTDGGRALELPEGQTLCLVGQNRLFAIATRSQKAIVALCVFSDGISRGDVVLENRKGLH